jgi:hypothetical protein
MSYALKQTARAASAVVFGMFIAVATAQTPDQTRDQTQDQAQTQGHARDKDQIYGSHLMTRMERAEHRKQMRSLKTEGERERFRQEHHKKMEERAKERGLTLPDMPHHNRGPASGGAGPGGAGKR